jgi:hypothetical protein
MIFQGNNYPNNNQFINTSKYLLNAREKYHTILLPLRLYLTYSIFRVKYFHKDPRFYLIPFLHQ